MKVGSVAKKLGSAVLHIVALAIIAYFFLPIATWYFEHRPILGVDFYNTATFARLFRDNLQFLPRSFLDFWYGGWPTFQTAVVSWFVPVGLVAKVLPLISAVKLSAVFSFFLLLVFTYLASYRLSKNHFASAAISVLVAYSGNMYGALVWGGSLPYFFNQALFPATLWLLASYLDTANKRWFWLAILVYGAALLGHMVSAGAFIITSSIILLLLGVRKVKDEEKVSIKSRIVEVLIFFFVGYLLAYRVTRGILSGLIFHFLSGNILNPFGLGGGSKATVTVGEGGLTVSGNQDLIAFERSQFDILFTDTNFLLFAVFGAAAVLFLIAFIVDKKKRKALAVIPWFLLAGYSVAHVFLNAYGVPILSQAWYRAFWHFPITLGLATASLIGYSQGSFGRLKKIVGNAFYVVIGVASILLLGFIYQDSQAGKTIAALEPRTSPASAHPEAINLVRTQEELDNLKPKLTPDWLDADKKNYRLFTSDAQLNVWWNTVFDMPLARGYLDPPVGIGRQGNHFLLDQAVAGNGLVENFDYPEDVAKNMALYYIDWYSVSALEGGRLSKSPNKGVSTYLEDEVDKIEEVDVKGAYILYETESGKPEIWEDVPQYLKYYKFKEELVSPILSASNAPVVLCICSWPAYEAFIKVLSMNNINSQYLVTAFWEKNIDSFSTEELANFDAIVLIDYRYGNREKAFNMFSDYVESGGKVIIDTGTEVKESENQNLPSIFPFSRGNREGLGREWDIEIKSREVFKGVDIDKFSPPLFNDDEWKFSYPTTSLKDGAEVLLEQAGKPLLIRIPFGEGEVIWSGMNLAYHVHSYSNFAESKLYVNLLESLVPLELNTYNPGTPRFVSARKAVFSTDKKGKGVLFRQQFWQGWKVKVNGKVARAYPAGPTYPGFIYVPVDPETGSGSLTVVFEYWGSRTHYLIWLMSGVLGLILIDLAVTDGRIVGKRLLKLGKKTKKRVGSWWEKEEEY